LEEEEVEGDGDEAQHEEEKGSIPATRESEGGREVREGAGEEVSHCNRNEA